MAADARIQLLDRLADVAIGSNMGDTIAASAALLLASLDSARSMTPMPEPKSFTELRQQLSRLLALCGWSDVDVQIIGGRLQ